VKKRLHHFAANVFRKRYTKFLQQRQSFVRDITKKVGVFLLDAVYEYYIFFQILMNND